MRQKKLQYIITFHTTAEAIAVEKACKEAGLPGRLIPVPRQISSGCGLSFCAPVQTKEELCRFLADKRLHFQEAGEYLI